MLRSKIHNSILPKFWNNGCLRQFKRFSKELMFSDGLLWRKGDRKQIVVTFSFMIEMLYKVHEKLAHVGRHKLLHTVQMQFWHPAMEKIARDLCQTCKFCQMYKTNILQERPPILKVDSKYQFYLMAMDLVKFPVTSAGNNAALIVVDHCSKWMYAAPIKNKSSLTITNILTDNGKEFVGKEVEDLLREYGINHRYASPYSPSCNGALEKINWTIISIIKGLTDNNKNWDKVLTKAVVIYNNTLHSQIKMTSSDYIMNNAHVRGNKILMDENNQETWREGHPKFRSFKLDERVLKKVNKIGNRVNDKFAKKFDGPYLIKKNSE